MTSTLILIGDRADREALLQKEPRRHAAGGAVRSDDERAQSLRALGAEIFVAELLDFRAVRRAFVGTKRAYFVYPMRPGLIEATAYYAQAAVEAGAEFLVNMSQRTARPGSASRAN
jgi:NAD(P)H dehydrogenase (quinone)